MRFALIIALSLSGLVACAHSGERAPDDPPFAEVDSVCTTGAQVGSDVEPGVICEGAPASTEYAHPHWRRWDAKARTQRRLAAEEPVRMDPSGLSLAPKETEPTAVSCPDKPSDVSVGIVLAALDCPAP